MLGPRQGKGYKVKSGKNFVGRADDMDIQILGIRFVYKYLISKIVRYMNIKEIKV